MTYLVDTDRMHTHTAKKSDWNGSFWVYGGLFCVRLHNLYCVVLYFINDSCFALKTA